MESFGSKFKVTLFGASHAPEVGVVIGGVPAGLELSEKDFETDVLRRAPSRTGTTERRESDVPMIRGGVIGGLTTGEEITIAFQNADIRPQHYAGFSDVPRPGHADYVACRRWGAAFCGGGIFSGRMTLPVVAAGVVAKKMLPGVRISAELLEIGGVTEKPLWDEALSKAVADGDSLGGVIECRVEGLPVGLGEPFWDSVESLISHAVFSIPGIRGIEFGDGFAAARMRGSQHNDPFGPDGPLKNGSGGINGGLTNGSTMVFRVAVKPTSSIAAPQRTWNFAKGRMETLRIRGRHDICFALRTPVIVEAMTAIVLSNI